MLDIDVRPGGVVVLAGRLDAAESDRTLEALAKLPGPLVLDCTALEYISSAGIGAIVHTYKRLLAEHHTLQFVGVAPRVKNVFMYAGLDKLLGIT
jgi:anti-sigma B factor antagonist